MKTRILMSLLTMMICVAASAQLPQSWLHISADDLTSGPLGSLTNQGLLGGSFGLEITGDSDNVVETVDGRKAVTFGGVNGFRSDITVPASLQGANPFTVHARIWVEDINAAETILAWGRRGGPNGSNAQFCFGNGTWDQNGNGMVDDIVTAFGAIQHWDPAFDMGWAGGTLTEPGGVHPTTGTWHDVVITYDGAVETVYADGVFNDSENKTLVVGSNMTEPYAFMVGQAANVDNVGGIDICDSSINMIQLYNVALSASQVAELATGQPTGAPSPQIQLSADSLPDGLLANWANTGTLGGSFMQDGLGSTGPVATMVAGEPAIQMDGTNTFISTDGLIVPNAFLGAQPWTVYARVYNEAIAGEDPIIEWAPRGGPDGTYAYFGFGSNAAFGLGAFWGAADLGYLTLPSAMAWHDIAMTYDGTNVVAYVDNVVDQTTGRNLDIGGDNTDIIFRIGGTEGGGIRSTIAIRYIEMFPGALSASQIALLPAGPFDPGPNAAENWAIYE